VQDSSLHFNTKAHRFLTQDENLPKTLVLLQVSVAFWPRTNFHILTRADVRCLSQQN